MSKKFQNELQQTSIPIQITHFATTGQGIGVVPSGPKQGMKGFFWNALPGENLTEFKLIKQKSNFFEAIATKIQTNSPYRTPPRDAQFLSTSPWQILDYEYELKQKIKIIQDLGLPISDIQTDYQAYFYRNKMEYALYYDHDTAKIHLAVHKRGTHQKMPIKNSSLEKTAIFNRATEIIEELNQSNVRASDFQSLLLRCNQNGEVSGGLLPKFQSHPKFPNLTDQINQKTYSYSPNGFFQINLPIYEQALKTISTFIPDDKPVLDLYAGVGTIGLSVTKHQPLTLVEINKSAFFELAINCKSAENHIFHPQPILAKSEDVTDFIQPDQTVILDPPRAGCDEKLIAALNQKLPSTICYLSCNPITQARDLNKLQQNYQISFATAFNFFPRTPHIETLLILTKNKVK